MNVITFVFIKRDFKFYIWRRNIFSEYRAKVDTYFKPDQRVLNWEFHPTHAFCRLDAFLQRLDAIKEIFNTAKEFLKIEKIEFGGAKGKLLGFKMAAVFRFE